MYLMLSPQSSAVMSVFVLAVALHPEAMRAAQKEIDNVVGRDRMPTIDDGPRMPYVHALVKEVLRWRSIVPLGKSVPSNLMCV